MFGHLTFKYYFMLKKHEYEAVITHVDGYAFFRLPALKNAYVLSKKDIRKNLVDTLIEIGVEQTPRELALYTAKIMFGILGKPGVDLLYEKMFESLFEQSDFETALFEALLDFKARSVPFKLAFEALDEPAQRAVLSFLHERMALSRFSWDAFFDTAEVLAILDSDFTRDTILSFDYAAALEAGQCLAVLKDVAKSHDLRLPLLYDALETVSDDAFSALIQSAETLKDDESAATRLMARNLLRKYTI